MTISTEVKQALMVALKGVKPASDGTEIMDVVASGQDAFDVYPVIRVVPSGGLRTINSTERFREYEIDFVISIYLEMGNTDIPDAQVISTIQELADNVMDLLDFTDWLPDVDGGTFSVVENATTSVIDTTPSKTGTALYCDNQYPIAFKQAI